MLDIVMNEQLIESAKILGFTQIIVAHEKSTVRLKENEALITSADEIKNAKKKSNLVIVKSSDKDRYVIEHEKPFMIIGLGESAKPDKTKKREIGINQVLCKLAVKNNVSFGFVFKSLLNANIEQRAIILGRWMHIARIARKYKVKCHIISLAESAEDLRDAYDFQAFANLIGF